jgi:hypothetical protein
MKYSLKPLPFVPVIIIGAGRSGTNALRDALVRLPSFATWPCDEIDAIWTYGNDGHQDDHFDAVLARPRVCSYIRKAFVRQWHVSGRPQFLVEKTCANSLRVNFINTVMPEARFVYIVRNGTHVVASARKRWRGELEMPRLPYLIAKARFVPLASIARRTVSFLARRLLRRQRHEDGRLGWWGPRICGHKAMYATSLDEVCARQWAECVQTAAEQLNFLPRDRVFQLRYEDLTRDPRRALIDVALFLSAAVTPDAIASAAQLIKCTDYTYAPVHPPLAAEVNAILEPVQQQLGYSN